MELKPQQLQALRAIDAFIKDKDSHVFILKGYAGTGKTTVIAELIRVISSAGKHPLLLAPTGRAAKVLRDKTSHAARTIHSVIYSKGKLKAQRYDDDGNLIVLQSSDDSRPDNRGVDKVEYSFGLKNIGGTPLTDGSPLTPEKAVILVDEASLISSRVSDNELFHFGSGNLLDDLLTFAQPHLGSKLVFVGDPAQLPPVGDRQSNALSEKYFEAKGLRVASASLTDVLRQAGQGAILKFAMKIRDLLNVPMRNSLTFEPREGELEVATAEDVIRRYLETQPTPMIGESIIICFSNAAVKEYNDRIRQSYFPGRQGVQTGDILQIVKNDYVHCPAQTNETTDSNLYNGDFVRVLSVAPAPEYKTGLTWKTEGGQRKRVQTQLTFRDIEFVTTDGTRFRTKIIETLLENDKPALTPDQQTALYILFRMEHKGIAHNAEAMESAMRADPYYNAIHVKYGYAITAHKSQGGEWSTAFVDYTARTGLHDDHLRWAYTATTRAVDRLYAVNPPHITPLASLTLGPIGKASKVPKGLVSLAPIEAAPEMASMSNFRRWKYASTDRGLREIGCSVARVEQLHYLDRYHILTPEGEETVDCHYSEAGIFTHYTPRHPSERTPEILRILHDESSYRYSISYTPAYPSLDTLRHKITSACDELNIQIMNIQEFTANYYVLYSFKTTGLFSTIKFCFNKNGSITQATPSSDIGAQDTLLVSLIDKLSI